ncbi:MAG: acetyl-CoA carboxylase biotin carboxyl carrier protein [Bryobacteraceae bacterium]|nr:acetyl-CoA carboxylase biotin carboxyl carrier protein [Bryobacteraceae bacterium]
MTIEEIKELIQVVNESGIAELEVARGDNRVRIRRSNAAPVSQEIIMPPAQMTVAAAPGTPFSAGAPAGQGFAPATGAAVPNETSAYVKSPIVGTFYESASAGSAPFVKIGDRVSAGQVLCIIESMKLMNEIESEISGVILSRLVDNGKPVEYGESLFAIQPA